MDGGLWRANALHENLKKNKKTVDKHKKIWYNIIKKSKETKETKTYEEHLV